MVFLISPHVYQDDKDKLRLPKKCIILMLANLNLTENYELLNSWLNLLESRPIQVLRQLHITRENNPCSRDSRK